MDGQAGDMAGGVLRHEAAMRAGLERSSAIVALGGGVAGDLAGFVAGSYLRGVAFVDATGHPGWIGTHPHLRPHRPSLRGCWPDIHPVEPKS